MHGDLISLVDENSTADAMDAISPARTSSISKSMAKDRHKSSHRDSFSDLTGLMKSKRPYTPIPPPAPQPLLAQLTNGTSFASRRGTGSSPLSPRATPFHVPSSLLAYFQEQELAPPTRNPPFESGYRDNDIRRLDSLVANINNTEIVDTTCQLPIPFSPYVDDQLIPGLDCDPPARVRPMDPPTPADSTPPATMFQSASQPVVQHVWGSMSNQLDALQIENSKLKKKHEDFQYLNESRQEKEQEMEVRLGKLRYQNEANRDQKAAMGRALKQKDMEIKKQQLEIDVLSKQLAEAMNKLNQLRGVAGELEYLRTTRALVEEAHQHAPRQSSSSKDQELEEAKTRIDNLEAALKQVHSERDSAVKAQMDVGTLKARVQTLSDTLAKRDKMNGSLQARLTEEHDRITQLEDEIENLRSKVDVENIDDLKDKLREKSRDFDRQRHQLKFAEQSLKVSEERVLKAADNGNFLRGAAHLVVPNANGKLPREVVACSECYAKNLTCDNHARCRNCKDSNVRCARWRCSLKHKLGECPDAPCKLPHDSQGWLVLHGQRPEW